MTDSHDHHLLLRAFVDELARCGVEHACTSPGSRNTPILLALVRDGRLRCSSHIDERAGGFHALGIAKASGRPAVLCCTSGTAAANYLPAVVEAREARVPLIVLTADRPPELRDVGAGQAIDQLALYGSAAKWFVDLGTHVATAQRLRWIRQLACRVVWTSLEDRPGAVHVNVALREPLVPGLAPDVEEPGGGGRADGRPWTARPPLPAGAAGDLDLIRERARSAQAPVVVAGRLERGGRRLAEAAQGLGVPLLADPLSGLRTGPAAVAHYDALLRDESFAREHRPDLVLRIGDLPTSKPLRSWLAQLDAEQLAVVPDGAWQDPDAVVAQRLSADPGDALAALAGVRAGDPTWLARWRDLDGWATRRIAAVLGDGLNEPRVAAELALLGSGTTVFVASSMPVRDAETFWPLLDDPPRVLSNRGANGIDGTVATAFGVAATGRRVVLHIGDVALAHDVGGLLDGARLGIPLTVLVVDNGGGGIFDFLPIAGEQDVFEQHVATPTGLDVERLAGLAGATYRAPATVAELARALREDSGGVRVVHVRTDRADNVALHRRVWEAVRAPA